jgi:hypothetical protein
MPYSAPALPAITMSFTTIGAPVELSPARTSTKTRSHIISPVSASSARRWPFAVA